MFKKKINPPKATSVPEKLDIHDDIRIDNFFWMNQRDTPEVLDYLNKENDYYKEITNDSKAFRESLFTEMKSRVKEDDQSVPYKLNGYWYITRYEEGKDYPVYVRKKGTLDAEEELLFNCNEMAEGKSYFNLKGINISRNNKLAAFAVDTLSRRIYTIYVKDLETGKIHETGITNSSGDSTWANDNQTLFYVAKDDQTLRTDRIYRHIFGTRCEEDVLVYKETDETFNTFVYKTKSKKYIIIGATSTLTSEFRILEADNPSGEFRIFQERIRGLEYHVFHYGSSFYILTNADNSVNFKLMETPEDQTGRQSWKDLIPHRKETLLEDVEIFKDFLVLSERTNGLNMLRILRWDGKDDYYLPFDNETYMAFTSANPDFETEWLRYTYTSLTTPVSTIDFNMVTREKVVKKEQEVLGGKFDKNNYVSERVWATAKDGTKIPISMVYRKGIEKDGTNPLLLYGYGSYGATIDPYFSSSRLSLLDRGFIYAIAHIRGGEYLGREWYDNGKLMKKMNTFTDFIDCTRFLIAEKYTQPAHMYAMGGSAGGLLMGAVANMAPELYNGMVASVPFVDVVTTMLDDSIPLTTGEYDEWGNPNERDAYFYMKSYSPYDNVKKQAYPNLLVITGYHDSQVQYWEPAKWVAKLREYKTDDNLVLFRTNMDAGHGGASGRFEGLKEVAEEYVFLLVLEQIES
ncbi:S9 family peptidase [Flavobacteriaceae bacterium M23B6Z8]